jgi:hypothetical protein
MTVLRKMWFISLIFNDSLSLEKQTEYERFGLGLPELTAAICKHYQLDEKLVATRGRLSNVSNARQLTAFFAITELGIKAADVADQLNVTQSGVSRLVKKGQGVCQREQYTMSSLIDA